MNTGHNPRTPRVTETEKTQTAPPPQALHRLAAALTTLAGTHAAQVSCNGGVSPIVQDAPDLHGGNILGAHDVSQARFVESPAVHVLRRVLLEPSTSWRAKKYLSGGRREGRGWRGVGREGRGAEASRRARRGRWLGAWVRAATGWRTLRRARQRRWRGSRAPTGTPSPSY